jgi:hypothetical protein
MMWLALYRAHTFTIFFILDFCRAFYSLLARLGGIGYLFFLSNQSHIFIEKLGAIQVEASANCVTLKA